MNDGIGIERCAKCSYSVCNGNSIEPKKQKRKHLMLSFLTQAISNDSLLIHNSYLQNNYNDIQ